MSVTSTLVRPSAQLFVWQVPAQRLLLSRHLAGSDEAQRASGLMPKVAKKTVLEPAPRRRRRLPLHAGQLENEPQREVAPGGCEAVVGSAADAMEAWLNASGITSRPRFRRINKAGRLGADALTGTAIRDIVKARCSLAGVGDDFSAHSLRSGFVTEAGRQNMPLQETMAMTGHRSADVVTGYFRVGAAQTSALARMMDAAKRSPDEN